MKLNPDCVRDILLKVESLPPKYVLYLRLAEPDYDIDEYVYAGKKLIEAGYIKGQVITFVGTKPDDVTAYEMTMKGHELLDNIRDNKVWSATKKTISTLSSVSLNVISEVASSIITSMILKI